MKPIETPAKGVKGSLLWNPWTERHFFRVYDKKNKTYTDYAIRVEDLEMEIQSNIVSIYAGTTLRPACIDWSTKYLKKGTSDAAARRASRRTGKRRKKASR